MSSVILSRIFDFGLEGKLHMLRRSEDENLCKSPSDPHGDDKIEPEVGPEMLWRKPEPETGGDYRSPDSESDSDGEGDSVDSDSDATITNETEDGNSEGYYYVTPQYDVSDEESVFEWEITTIPEETEDEEEEEVKVSEIEALVLSESRNGGSGDGGIDPTPMVVQQELPGELSNAGGSDFPGESLFRDYEPREDEHEQREGWISTRDLDDGKSGTKSQNSKSSRSTTTDQEPHHDSPTFPTNSDSWTSDRKSGSDALSEFQSSPLLTVPEESDDKESALETSHQQPTDDRLSPTDFLSEEDNKEFIETGMHTNQQRLGVINNNGMEGRLRSVLRKPGTSKARKGRCVTFNESLNLFYDAECSCWVHEDDYARYRQEEYERREREELYQYEPIQLPVEYDEPPTLSPPEGYKDRFFPQELHADPDVTRVSPPSPPTARRKVFLRDGPTANGQEEEVEEESNKKKDFGGRLWRSNSSDGKKVVSPPEEPDVIKCTESSSVQTTGLNSYSTSTGTSSYSSELTQAPTKVSIGTAPLRTSEQIRLAVDSTLRSRKNKKPECSTLVEKLRWLTSLEDEDSSDSNQSGFATWPSPRDKNGVPIPASSQTRKSDAGTSTNEEHFVQSSSIRVASVHEAKIKQISYTLEDIEEGLKGSELELETFVSKDGGRIERIRKRYGEEGGDDYGFSRRPSVKGIKPKFSSTNQIFAQFTNRKSMESPAFGAPPNHAPSRESEYENTRLPAPPPPVGSSTPLPDAVLQSDPARNSAALNYEFQNTPGRQSEESRAHFELIRQSFETATAGGAPNFITNFNRPHSWSVSTLPHPHHNHGGGVMQLGNHHLISTPQTLGQQQPSQQPLYGTVRRVPNVIGRPLFLHYGALSVEAHPNKIPYPTQAAVPVKVPETPSPTQPTPVIPAGMRYYGPPIRYYNQPPPVPPRTVTAPVQMQGVVVPAPVPVGINNLNMPPNSSANHTHPHVNVMTMNEVERGVPEGATDEEHLAQKEAYSMNV